jgi:hypothetical protein
LSSKGKETHLSRGVCKEEWDHNFTQSLAFKDEKNWGIEDKPMLTHKNCTHGQSRGMYKGDLGLLYKEGKCLYGGSFFSAKFAKKKYFL